MSKTFFFYDLETSGLSARNDRVMQFAGQRTTMELEPIGDPVNLMVSLSDDILPSPDAIMVTGITPQMTRAEGYSEAEFCKILGSDIFSPDTIAVGYNNVRFDDEFVRHTLWRNFYDPYEWAWADGRSRWDLLDVVRMTRALRPDGIEWPVDEAGKAVNKLELIASQNGLVHTRAHDALSDVEALIQLTKLIRMKQPKLYEYLLGMRDKKAVMELVDPGNPKPFVYSSGRYDAAYEKTTVAYPIAKGVKPGSVLVYDLRHDPVEYVGATPKQLAEVVFADYETRKKETYTPLPVKELSYNKCPAVAPLGVMDEASKQRLGIDMNEVKRHVAIIVSSEGFKETVRQAFEMREPYEKSPDVEHQLYDGFIDGQDKIKVSAVRAASRDELAKFTPTFKDSRLPELFLRYKARQYPEILDDAEREKWERYRLSKISSTLPQYMSDLARLQKSGADEYLLQELQLWAESIVPSDTNP